MRKFWMYTIPALVLVGFMLFMNSGDYLKKPMSANDDVPYHLKQLETDVMREDWQAAGQDLDQLNQAWSQVRARIQFSVEKDEVQNINVGLARLEGYLAAEDQSNSLAEISEIREHWININQ